MITVEDVQDFLPEENPTLIEKTIKRVQGYLVSYTNNKDLFLEDDIALEDIVLMLVLRRLNPDTKHSAGKKGESFGDISFTFAEDLPEEVKFALLPYQRVEIL